MPYMMDRLDRSYDIWAGRGVTEFSEWVKKRPSEYISSGNVYFSAEGDEEGIGYAIKRLGPDVILYASDFPHETNAERAIHEIDELLERESEPPGRVHPENPGRQRREILWSGSSCRVNRG